MGSADCSELRFSDREYFGFVCSVSGWRLCERGRGLGSVI